MELKKAEVIGNGNMHLKPIAVEAPAPYRPPGFISIGDLLSELEKKEAEITALKEQVERARNTDEELAHAEWGRWSKEQRMNYCFLYWKAKQGFYAWGVLYKKHGVDGIFTDLDLQKHYIASLPNGFDFPLPEFAKYEICALFLHPVLPYPTTGG